MHPLAYECNIQIKYFLIKFKVREYMICEIEHALSMFVLTKLKGVIRVSAQYHDIFVPLGFRQWIW